MRERFFILNNIDIIYDITSEVWYKVDIDRYVETD